MCGISAVFRFDSDPSRDLADLRRMHDAQRHRGPDGEGVLIVGEDSRGTRFERIPSHSQPFCFAGAVRRLRVSDPRPEADQPLVSADGQFWTMLNGAIYNYRELTAELSAAGHSLRTGSDTEVVLEAYRRWGTACFERFDGMWAILIVDLARKRLIGSRDRIGIKPFYFALDSGRILFASEPWAVAQVHQAGPAIEPARFFEFLSGYPPRSSELTFYRGINPVPAATWFELELASSVQNIRFQPFWRLADFHSGGRTPPDFTDAAARFSELLTRSVATQSLADVKVGALMSGGLDSSSIVMLWSELARERRSQRPDTISISWDDPQMSERPYIEAIAARAQADSHILELNHREVWRSVDDVVRAQAQPLLGQDLIAQYHAYRFARQKGDVVIMDGNGLDEVQAGLPSYEAQMVVERLKKLDFFTAASELKAIAREYGRSYAGVLRSYVYTPLRRNFRERHALPHYPWLDVRGCDTSDPAWTAGMAKDWGTDPSHLNRILYRETRHTNIPAVLMYSDRNSMAHSVEARFPYLDHRLIEHCFSLPPEYKVGFGRRKRLLYDVAKTRLPPMVIENKQKMRFVLMNSWMPLRGEHAQTVRDASRHPAFAKLPYVDTAKMQNYVDEYLGGKHDNGYAVWRIFTASRWLDMFGL
jgi:asparagine synthase (glutamine-hydrolysing)